MNIVITAGELATRKCMGTVYLCRSCKDMRNKIVLIGVTIGGLKEIRYGFCDPCARIMQGDCESCRKPK